MTWLAVAGAFLLASYVKGTTGMGFPLIATPMVALGAFWVGLRTQDRVRQETFIRILHVLLAGMAVFFLYRGLVIAGPSR